MEMPDMSVSWHPLGPEKPEPKPSRYPRFDSIREAIAPIEKEFEQFARNCDLTDEDVLGLLAGTITEKDIQRRRYDIVFEQRVQRVMIAYENFNTRHLLSRYQRYGGGWQDIYAEYAEEYRRIEVEKEALKRTLDAREHVERDRKKVRRDLAKAARGQNKSKNR